MQERVERGPNVWVDLICWSPLIQFLLFPAAAAEAEGEGGRRGAARRAGENWLTFPRVFRASHEGKSSRVHAAAIGHALQDRPCAVVFGN